MTHLTYPNESAEYRAARNALRAEETALREHIEAVAARRRALPPGGTVPEDYVFERIGKNDMCATSQRSRSVVSRKRSGSHADIASSEQPATRQTVIACIVPLQ